MNYVKRMREFVSTVNFESMQIFLVASIIHLFIQYSDYICNSLYVTRIFAEPQIYYHIFDIFSIFISMQACFEFLALF